MIVTYYHFIRAYENKPGGIGVFIGYGLVLMLLAFSLNGHVVKNAYFVNGALVHDITPWNYILAVIIFPILQSYFILCCGDIAVQMMPSTEIKRPT